MKYINIYFTIYNIQITLFEIQSTQDKALYVSSIYHMWSFLNIWSNEQKQSKNKIKNAWFVTILMHFSLKENIPKTSTEAQNDICYEINCPLLSTNIQYLHFQWPMSARTNRGIRLTDFAPYKYQGQQQLLWTLFCVIHRLSFPLQRQSLMNEVLWNCARPICFRGQWKLWSKTMSFQTQQIYFFLHSVIQHFQ